MYVYDGTPGAPIALLSSGSIQQFGYDYDPYGVPTISQNSGRQAVPAEPEQVRRNWGEGPRRLDPLRQPLRQPTTGAWTQQDDLDHTPRPRQRQPLRPTPAATPSTTLNRPAATASVSRLA